MSEKIPELVRVKIVSNSTPAGTYLMLPDGRALDDVATIDWHLEAGELARVTVVFECIPAEITRPPNWDGPAA